MKYTIILFYLLFLVSACSQSQPKTAETWLKENTIELKAKEAYDFQALGELIGDKRIIAIGESTHGLSEFYALKSALVQYLHQEHDFEILAMESGLGDVNLAWTDINTLSTEVLMEYTVFRNFRCEEITPLFEYIKAESQTERPLIYAGFDTQMSSNYFLNRLKSIVAVYDKPFSDTLSEGFSYYYKMAQAGRNLDSLGFLDCRNVFTNTAERAKKILIDHSDEVKKEFSLSDLQMKFMIKTLASFSASVDLSFENRNGGIGLRDKLMAANFEWLIDEVYPNKKVILWGHNGHLEKGNISEANIKWMGHFLKEKYKDDYYALGLFAYKGEAYRFWDNEIVPFEQTDSLYISNIMSRIEKEISYLDISTLSQNDYNEWLFKEVNAFELENGGHLTFIPKKRFDGLITVKESGPPTFK